MSSTGSLLSTNWEIFFQVFSSGFSSKIRTDLSNEQVARIDPNSGFAHRILKIAPAWLLFHLYPPTHLLFIFSHTCMFPSSKHMASRLPKKLKARQWMKLDSICSCWKILTIYLILLKKAWKCFNTGYLFKIDRPGKFRKFCFDGRS